MDNAEVTEWYVTWGKFSDDSHLRKWLFTEHGGIYHFWDRDRADWCVVKDPTLRQSLAENLNNLLWAMYDEDAL